MQVKTFIPQQSHIKKLIDRYIFIEGSTSKKMEMTCFPNNNYCLGIILNRELKKNKNGSLVFTSSKENSHYLTGIYTKPTKFIFQGKNYRELCIDFKPLAFKLFGLENLNKSKFEYQPFKNNKQLDFKLLTDITIETFSKKINPVEVLDNYFSSAIKEDFTEEYHALNFQNNETISDLKQTLLKSERGTYRFFANNLGLSPHQFLSIQKFQKCAAAYQANLSLINIAYDVGLTDCSHINKLFKKFSGFSPTQFKKEVSSFNNLLLKV